MMVDKKMELEKLKRQAEQDESLPLRNGATQLVFGEGNPDADIYFLGEAPGFFEDREGRPFVGQAGKLLNQLLESLGLQRPDVYISNVVRFRPPQNRDPLPGEIEAFRPYVDREIAIIEPKLIVTLGRFSMSKFLPGVAISHVHGKVYRLQIYGRNVIVIPMYHPAAALRSDQVRYLLEQDFRKIPEILRQATKATTEQLRLTD